MIKEAFICSLVGAIALGAISPEPTDARRSIRRSNRSEFYQPGQRRQYRNVSYTLAQIDRSGAAPVRRQRQPQAERDERFPIRSEPAIAREPQSNVNQTQADSLRNYAEDQPDYALRKMLGRPTRADDNSDVYDIHGSGSPFQASRRLVIHYQWSTQCNCRVGNWHQE